MDFRTRVSTRRIMTVVILLSASNILAEMLFSIWFTVLYPGMSLLSNSVKT